MSNWPLYLRLPYWRSSLSDDMDQSTARTIDQLFRGNDKLEIRGDGVSRNRHQFEFNPLLPLGLIMVVCTVVFILIVFRRWPGLIAGIIAGCLTSISIYLMLLAFREQRLVYE
ncbi:unnamed protein product [Hermetia illucens]|uniref:Uncharacterized protein n=1 Tax=Hermetia illucens TaxID=343691 RepID=A0A7R8V2I1_HERIL|nr:uncharacterized protein LOC119658262 [Hermetia illucens]CAD7090912.1 unnamed protein product [Hermetia illucens]